MAKKIIVILNSVSDFERFESLNQLDYKNILLFTMDLKLRFFLKKASLPFKSPEEFLTKEETLLIDEIAYKIAENWHNNIFKFKYISLAKVMEFEFKGFLSRIIKNAQVIKNVFANEKPLKIIFFNDNNNVFIKEFKEILKYICKKQNIKLGIFSGGVDKSKSDLLNLTPKIKSRKYYKFARSIITIAFLYLIYYFRLLIPPIKNKNKNKKNILIYQYRLYNFHPSIMTKLLKNPKLNIFIFDFRINIRKLKQYLLSQFTIKKDNIDIFFFEIFRDLNLRIKKRTLKHIENNYKIWLKEIKINKINKKFIYNDFNLWPIVKKKIITAIKTDFRRIIENCLIIEFLLKHKKINLIILNSSDIEFEYLHVLVSNNLNISSLIIDHGLPGLDTVPLTPFPNPFTKYAIWGGTHKQAFVQKGINSERIIRTGSPRFDKYIQINNNPQLKSKIKKLVFEDFHIGINKKIVFLSPPLSFFFNFGAYPSEIEKIITCILKGIKNLSNIYLIIKLHPMDESLDLYNELIEEFGINNASAVRHYNSFNLLVSCDCLITKYSTIGLEAMILGKPVICLNFYKEKIHYIVNKAAFELSNCNELPSIIKNFFENPLLKSKERKQFVEKYNYKNDGLATQRVYRIIINLLNNRIIG